MGPHFSLAARLWWLLPAAGGSSDATRGPAVEHVPMQPHTTPAGGGRKREREMGEQETEAGDTGHRSSSAIVTCIVYTIF